MLLSIGHFCGYDLTINKGICRLHAAGGELGLVWRIVALKLTRIGIRTTCSPYLRFIRRVDMPALPTIVFCLRGPGTHALARAVFLSVPNGELDESCGSLRNRHSAVSDALERTFLNRLARNGMGRTRDPDKRDFPIT